ncbi:hypothetical protein [Niallia nealsonii]|uniref:Uncharacterized protein n=1 Tax=Niallia nealsonii TaxID=115979 RepID=A0A2N0Z384_9BACI|nr:hypothetical protein [Niallia nealsonii]PKG23967.1 hypothetical protein CWS01_09365 [Niallia nealsonii]
MGINSRISTGFITDMNEVKVKIKTLYKRIGYGTELNTRVIWREKLTSAPIVKKYSKEEIHFLMHLVVNTNDKAWFEELSKKREFLSVN